MRTVFNELLAKCLAPDYAEPFTYAVYVRKDSAWTSERHGGSHADLARHDLSDAELLYVMCDKADGIVALPTGSVEGYANYLHLDIDYHGTSINPMDWSWLTEQDGIVWATSDHGIRYLEVFDSPWALHELDDLTEYIQSKIEGKVDVRSYQPGSFLSVPTRYTKAGVDLLPEWERCLPQLSQMLARTTAQTPPSPSSPRGSSIGSNNPQKVPVSGSGSGTTKMGRPKGRKVGSERQVAEARRALHEQLEGQLRVDIQAGLRQALQKVQECTERRSAGDQDTAATFARNGDLARDYPEPTLHLFVPVGSWNDHILSEMPTLPLDQVEGYVLARSAGLPDAELKDRIQRATWIAAHRHGAGTLVPEQTLDLLVETVLELVPRPRRGGSSPEAYHVRRVTAAVCLFLQARRSRLDQGEFFLTAYQMAYCSGWFKQQHRLELQQALASFKQTILPLLRQAFPTVLDAAGLRLGVLDKQTYQTQRFPMNLYRRSELGEQLVASLGALVRDADAIRSSDHCTLAVTIQGDDFKELAEVTPMTPSDDEQQQPEQVAEATTGSAWPSRATPPKPTADDTTEDELTEVTAMTPSDDQQQQPEQVAEATSGSDWPAWAGPDPTTCPPPSDGALTAEEVLAKWAATPPKRADDGPSRYPDLEAIATGQCGVYDPDNPPTVSLAQIEYQRRRERELRRRRDRH